MNVFRETFRISAFFINNHILFKKNTAKKLVVIRIIKCLNFLMYLNFSCISLKKNLCFNYTHE